MCDLLLPRGVGQVELRLASRQRGQLAARGGRVNAMVVRWRWKDESMTDDDLGSRCGRRLFGELRGPPDDDSADPDSMQTSIVSAPLTQASRQSACRRPS